MLELFVQQQLYIDSSNTGWYLKYFVCFLCQFKYCVFIYVKLENEECDPDSKDPPD